MRQLLFKHSDGHTLSCLSCYHPARLIARRLCRVCTLRLAVEPPSAGGYGCSHVDCPNTTKAARSQPSQLDNRAMADSTGHVDGPDRPHTTG